MKLQNNPGARTFFEFLDVPLTSRVRWALVALAVLIGLSYLFPLWRISMVAPQYPKGLWLDIFSWKLVGGHEGRDLDEINILNHYIGMKRIDRYELVDLNWLPIAYGGLALLLLRAALLGSVRTLVDMTVLSAYVCTFAFGRFVWMLYKFGHELDPTAPMDVEPFTPALIGSKQIANFTTSSWPLPGAWLLGVFFGGLVLVTLLALRDGRRSAQTRALAAQSS
ncbi:MAG: hypothetical protein IT457_23560 [Planctomycetes bacterium]|nr:hypothetical protein [Planctomycetota bacterium]